LPVRVPTRARSVRDAGTNVSSTSSCPLSYQPRESPCAFPSFTSMASFGLSSENRSISTPVKGRFASRQKHSVPQVQFAREAPPAREPWLGRKSTGRATQSTTQSAASAAITHQRAPLPYSAYSR
jgi:hypothetical protein